MTDAIHILRCARCGKSFSYVPTDEDKCPPGSPSQICDECAELLIASMEWDHADYEGESK